MRMWIFCDWIKRRKENALKPPLSLLLSTMSVWLRTEITHTHTHSLIAYLFPTGSQCAVHFMDIFHLMSKIMWHIWWLLCGKSSCNGLLKSERATLQLTFYIIIDTMPSTFSVLYSLQCLYLVCTHGMQFGKHCDDAKCNIIGFNFLMSCEKSFASDYSQ